MDSTTGGAATVVAPLPLCYGARYQAAASWSVVWSSWPSRAGVWFRPGPQPVAAGLTTSARRCSLEERTPPVSPPLSPTLVLPHSPNHKRAATPGLHAPQAAPNESMIQLRSLDLFERPLCSPLLPPGFHPSPTPPMHCTGPLQRTPSPSSMRPLLAKSVADPVQELFAMRKQGILPTPPSPPPRRPATCRLTMAGVRISSKCGFTLQRCRLAGKEVVPAAKVAEKMVEHTLGITRDGKDVTQATLDDFSAKFSD
ncbi:hypothetical protein ZWY2020_010594 [Hordeum vulgare]|nr:hypothetical protein ZWY2020_010594 [Hordeum vulgare]